MFHPLGIVGGIVGWNPQGQQEIVDRSMTLLASVGEPFSSGGENDGSVRFALDESVPFQSSDRSVHRHVADPEMASDLCQTTGPIGFDQVRDRLHVILRNFRRVVFSDADMLTGWR